MLGPAEDPKGFGTSNVATATVGATLPFTEYLSHVIQGLGEEVTVMNSRGSACCAARNVTRLPAIFVLSFKIFCID